MIAPDDVARAARRITAKMVADQGVPVMLSIVGLRSGADGADGVEPTDGYGVVLVARGEAADRILDLIRRNSSGEPLVEAVPV